MSSTSSTSKGPAQKLAAHVSSDATSSQILSSTLDYIKTSASNATSNLSPSPMDLLLVLPRMVARAGSFALITVPERIDSILGLKAQGTIIAEATREGAYNVTSATFLGAGYTPQNTSAAAVATAAIEGTQLGVLGQALSFQHVRNFGGIFSYLTSKWALGCFTAAVILNRTQIYASPRRHINLGLKLRLALRIVPILVFFYQAITMLQAMRCQTSSDYFQMRYGGDAKRVASDYAGDGGLLYYLSSNLLFWQDDQGSCLAVNMILSKDTETVDIDDSARRGSLSLLWPLFQSLCLSQFVETLSCAVQGRPLMTETGMSIFEHSLAFAESEAMVGTKLGFGLFGPFHLSLPKEDSNIEDASDMLTKASKRLLFGKMNTPPEVLLIGLISSLNNLSSHILGVIGMQGRFRLINTGLWGLCFMSSFVWGFIGFTAEAGLNASILRFPTVCIVGFIPHLLIFIGIFMCACIYSLALILFALSPPDGLPQPQTWRERFEMAQENLQANVQLSTIRISMHEDFYTGLLKVGFTALTVASEAVYLNEGRRISVGQWTWLEEERMNDIEHSRQTSSSRTPIAPVHFRNSTTNAVSDDIEITEDQGSQSSLVSRQWKSGYARERTSKALKGGYRNPRSGSDGVGAMQRGGRYYMAWELFSGIFWLITGWAALALIKLFETMGISRQPAWLSRMSGVTKTEEKIKNSTPLAQAESLPFWILSDDGNLSLPDNDSVDVEAETKKRLRDGNVFWGREEEQILDSKLYEWWKHGGWWGERDNSGDYAEPEEIEHDNTSLVSTSDDGSNSGWESDSDSFDGRRTPTQREPYPYSRETIPITDSTLDPASLARLLNPRDPQQRQEARMLAHHLASSHVVTRSQYRHSTENEKSHLLTSTRYRPAGFKVASPSGKLNSTEEAELLESIIMARRSSSLRMPADISTSGAAWRDGAEGLGAGGPQCVICQCAPRTILAWPCRCLSLCEDCRVNLAMNNFGTCVCCRQDVLGFSRLYVP